MEATPQTMSEPMDPTTETPSDGVDRGGATDGDWITSPVDDATYDLLMALASKLEAIDTYRVYAGDGNPELWQGFARDERRHADRLVQELRGRLTSR